MNTLAAAPGTTPLAMHPALPGAASGAHSAPGAPLFSGHTRPSIFSASPLPLLGGLLVECRSVHTTPQAFTECTPNSVPIATGAQQVD